MSLIRTLSAVVAAIYLILAFTLNGPQLGLQVGLFLILPIGCIWFADTLGSYTGPTQYGTITSPSPPILIRIAGWILLLLPVLLVIVYALAKPR